MNSLAQDNSGALAGQAFMTKYGLSSRLSGVSSTRLKAVAGAYIKKRAVLQAKEPAWNNCKDSDQYPQDSAPNTASLESYNHKGTVSNDQGDVKTDFCQSPTDVAEHICLTTNQSKEFVKSCLSDTVGDKNACCDGACVNTQIDYNNCGACGVQCNKGEECNAGVCTSLAVCGNGVKELGEQCDDGNTDDMDGCTNDCMIGAKPKYADLVVESISTTINQSAGVDNKTVSVSAVVKNIGDASTITWFHNLLTTTQDTPVSMNILSDVLAAGQQRVLTATYTCKNDHVLMITADDSTTSAYQDRVYESDETNNAKKIPVSCQ